MTNHRPLSWSEHAYASFAARSAETREERDSWAAYVCRRAMGKLAAHPVPGRTLSRGAARKLVRRALVLHTKHLVQSVLGIEA